MRRIKTMQKTGMPDLEGGRKEGGQPAAPKIMNEGGKEGGREGGRGGTGGGGDRLFQGPSDEDDAPGSKSSSDGLWEGGMEGGREGEKEG